ncbi:ABC transporter ATP-binding protein [Dactylosporangium matsuzakiense]|uniref:Dipeptide/oligopeptide/nickel ABC transporter ATP-binding protein n=1 Tax=Dactylosporangium matsuzakiense TaxID=53360 RepID=A0A9W6KJ88_9ACTN|nr:ABC transporter ATP-binding protein [Dactylosporangium matsuzakiense]GLL02208.1 dipeptide/oligopeptide/nickel ABC transporter ATP-binding protein [Dactylosporangium matsuzakiense]
MTTLLEVDDLTVDFDRDGERSAAVRGVSFAVEAGERVGIVGESGSGKSVTAQAVMRLLPQTAGVGGQVRFDGHDVLTFDAKRLARWRGADIAMVFQDPMSSLNPLLRIGTQLAEGLRHHRGLGKAAAREESARLLRTVGIGDAERRLKEYPHAFSGGMRQRVCIAIAAACTPRLIVADEPTTALDVTVQAQVLDLLDELTDSHGTATILISHDLGVVSSFCDRILIMYAGRVVESGPTDEIVARPTHPYTRALLDSIPRLRGDLPRRLPTIPGAPPFGGVPAGQCSFAGRCPRAQDLCRTVDPQLRPTGPGVSAACHFPLGDGDA